MPSSGKVLYLGLDPTHYPSTGQITHWPIIQIVPRHFKDPLIQKALDEFDRYTHLVFTSKSAVDILKSFLIQLEIPLGKWTSKKNLAVGKATAKYLEGVGMKEVITASKERAEGIIELIQTLPLENAHFFWPHSSKSNPALEDFFKVQKISYTSSVFYDPKPYIPSNLPSLTYYDEIVFTSPSTIDAFLEIFKKFPPHIQLSSIGPVTEAYLNKILNC